MKIVYFKTHPIYRPINSINETQREINVYMFHDCKITGHTMYYPNVLLHPCRITKADLSVPDCVSLHGGEDCTFEMCNSVKNEETLILPLLERTMSLGIGTIYEKNGMKYYEYKEDITSTVYENPLFFFIYNTDNYFHFLYDSLPYLISYFKLKDEIPNLKLLMQYPNEQKNSLYNFVTEFLELLSIGKDDIILVNKTTIYKEIYVSTSYTHDIDSNLPPRQEIYGFYKKMVENAKQNFGQIETPAKIYISRRTWLHNDFSNIGTNYTTRRRLVNEDDIVDQLKKKGFVEVFTERLSTLEKVLYFANATHVVGAIGGGISNVLFSPKETKLEALVSPTFLDVNARFKYSLDCVDVFYNLNSEHVEKTEFKTYMRVQSKDGKIIGEIEKIHDNTLLVSYTDGSNTGWNAQNVYKHIELQMKDVDKLDKGLNSPWFIKDYNELGIVKI